MDGMDDLLQEFITDTNETLEQVDERLVELESEDEPAGRVNELFRMMHTIKGTCGFLGLNRMASLAHSAETLMDKLRNGGPVTQSSVDVMLKVADRLKQILAGIEANGGSEPAGDDSAILNALQAAMDDADAAPAPADEPVPAPGGNAAESGAMAAPANDAAEPADGAGGPAPKADAADAAAGETPTGDAPQSERSIRVSVETLEYLMTVVSELVLTRNELSEVMRDEEASSSKLALQRLSTVTSELQQAVMSTRMQPIGNAWRKLPRIVRDVSSGLGKKIELEMTGASTELDRQVLESIKDPLVHMVRNACDHGIETPTERRAAGKPEVGHIVLNAYHEGGQILVEIRDDGRGLNLDRLKTKAVDRGIATQEEVEKLSNEQIYSFIFEPGFSTAKVVTSVSGRGVGMDVVQSNVERIGGSIDVRSQPGVGSVFTLKIPLTLAIVRALILGLDDEVFAIPQTAVDELLRVEPGGQHAIQLIKNAPILRSRDRLLPIVDLRASLGLDLRPGAAERVTDETTEGFVMVMRVRGLTFGILVDQVLRTEEIVVKPLPSLLRGSEAFSGSTILGDGRVIMIVDPNGVRAAATTPAEVSMPSRAATKDETVEDDDDGSELLLMFKAGSQNRKVLPISLVTRLEDVDLADAKISEGQWLFQYNNELIPLVWFDGAPEVGTTGRKPTLIMSDHNRSMGLVVDEILDIQKGAIEVQIPSEKNGILGSAVVNGRPSEVVDVAYFLGLASQLWFDPTARKMQQSDRIMLVDDSAFFRNLVAPVVRSAGYEPITFASAPDALAKLSTGFVPSVIVTDVDMPEMDGFAFAAECQKLDHLARVPIVALTGVVSDEAVARARAAGFADYVSKLDRTGLLSTLRELTHPVGEEIAA